MRAPRYQFPERVRSATRAMAVRMADAGDVPATAEELEGWIGRAPDVEEELRAGGYGDQFSADDLLPLLHVMVTQAGGSPPRAAAGGGRHQPPRRLTVILGGLALLVFGIVVYALVRSAAGAP